MIRSAHLVIFILMLISGPAALACQCPGTSLDLEEANKYEIIFRGKVLSVKTCADKFGEAVFEIEELYKGNSAKQFTVLFECDNECTIHFLEGEEWIIYSRYKQVNSAMMDWCSRSRKFFSNPKEDFYSVNYGNDYDEELTFLREKLGRHRLLPGEPKEEGSRNKLPNTGEAILMVLCSLAGIVLFYWLFNKYFKF